MAKKKVSRQSVRRSSKHRQRDEEHRKRQQRWFIGGIVLAVTIIIAAVILWQGLGIGANVEDGRPLADGEDERPLADIDPIDRNGYFSDYPEMLIDTNKTYEAVIQTNKGNIRVRLLDDEAPLTVNNFVFLSNQGFYDGLTFHRVITDFMAQGGDPTGLGFGGPGYQFADETDNELVFDKPGLLAMANSGPDTNGSQFFITFAPTPHLNGLHTIFGEVVEGEDVLLSLELVQPDPSGSSEPGGDLIERITIFEDGITQ